MSSFGDAAGFSLLDLFKMEAESHCQSLGDGLLALERNPDDTSPVDGLMRAAHSIKGAARIVGLDVVVGLAHAMEDRFVDAQKGRERLGSLRVDQMLKAVDLLQELRSLAEADLASWTESRGATIADLVERLNAPIVEAAKSVASSPAPPPVPAPVADPVPAATLPPAAASEPAVADSQRGATGASASTPPAASPAPLSVPSGAASSTAGGAASSVRVASTVFARMVYLAGASTIEAGRLQLLRADLALARARQRALEAALAALRESLRTSGAAPAAFEQPLAELHAATDRLREGLVSQSDTFEESARRLEELCDSLHHEVLKARLRPFGEGTTAFPRMVRDIARELGKQVEFRVAGDATLVDRDILQKLDAPLTHMLRNSLDHGIETPEERIAAGKPANATITLSAHHHGGMLTIEVRDDGRGIDPELVRRRVVEKRLVDESTAARLSTPELMDFLFLPGFSTKQAVSEISGRGVGLDVVQSMVQAVSGTLGVETRPGRGIRFTLRLPVTLSVVRAAIADVGSATLAFPLARLETIVSVPASEMGTVQGRLQFTLEGASIGLLHAASVLELEADAQIRDPAVVLVIGTGDDRCGIAVDQLRGEEDLAVRPLDARFGAVPHVAAAAIRADGNPVLVVDVEDVSRSLKQSLHGGRLRGAAALQVAASAHRRRILVVDDSITVREVERQLLVRHGFDVETAVDGKDGFNALRTGKYDLLVTDVDMPRMNGIELVRAVRQDSRFSTIPIVIVSYKDREEDRLAGFDAGANAYLTKSSFQDDTFTRTIEDLLRQHAPAGSSLPLSPAKLADARPGAAP